MCNLGDFLGHKGINFTTVDISQDTYKLRKSWLSIPPEHHFDIQKVFTIPGRSKAGMAAIAALLIDPAYANMKKKFKSDSREDHVEHDFWDYKPLSPMNLHYAAVDGYLSYEL